MFDARCKNIMFSYFLYSKIVTKKKDLTYHEKIMELFAKHVDMNKSSCRHEVFEISSHRRTVWALYLIMLHGSRDIVCWDERKLSCATLSDDIWFIKFMYLYQNRKVELDINLELSLSLVKILLLELYCEINWFNTIWLLSWNTSRPLWAAACFFDVNSNHRKTSATAKVTKDSPYLRLKIVHGRLAKSIMYGLVFIQFNFCSPLVSPR